MKIFLDTNFIIDYILREEYRNISIAFLTEGRRRNYKFYISYLSVANFAYIARRLPKKALYEKIGIICRLFKVIKNTNKQIKNALSIEAGDFEDVLQYMAACEAECECIISRNQKDFAFSKIPVRSAQEYIAEFFSNQQTDIIN